MFTVQTAASDRNLLTLAEMKAALAGVGSLTDPELAALGLQISDMIAIECHVPADGVMPPTLRRESIVETFRQVSGAEELILARRFVDTVFSVTVDGVTLGPEMYEADKGAGLLARICSSGGVVCWYGCTIVVTYTAGFQTVPEPLKLAARTVLREQWSATVRDPLIKREKVDGVGETEYWVNASTGSEYGAISGPACAMLSPYRYHP